MSAQAETMAPPTSTESRIPLYRGIAAVGIAAIPSAAVFSILDVRNRTIAPVVLVIASAAGMGAIVGLVSRFVLPRRRFAIRWLVALFGLSLGMTFLGWLSRGLLGMDLIQRSTTEPDWLGLLRFMGGAAVAWLAIRAWDGQLATGSSPLFRRRGRARIGKTTLTSRKPRRIGRLGRRKRGAAIRLATQVEHRCPFCLEIVKSRDPRGSVECSTCHSLHHADCWAVTGTCQVPHHNG